MNLGGKTINKIIQICQVQINHLKMGNNLAAEREWIREGKRNRRQEK